MFQPEKSGLENVITRSKSISRVVSYRNVHTSGEYLSLSQNMSNSHDIIISNKLKFDIL